MTVEQFGVVVVLVVAVVFMRFVLPVVVERFFQERPGRGPVNPSWSSPPGQIDGALNDGGSGAVAIAREARKRRVVTAGRDRPFF